MSFQYNYSIITVKKIPRFSEHRGRTWDNAVIVILPNGQEVKGYLDTTWGCYVYFNWNNQLKKAHVDMVTDVGKMKLDLRNFYTQDGKRIRHKKEYKF